MLVPPEGEISLPKSGQDIPRQQRRFITLEEQVGLGETANSAAAAAAASKQAREQALGFLWEWVLNGEVGDCLC